MPPEGSRYPPKKSRRSRSGSPRAQSGKSTGRSCRRSVNRRRPCETRSWVAKSDRCVRFCSIGSEAGLAPPRRRTSGRLPAALISASPACRRRTNRSSVSERPGPDAWERLVDALLASPHYGEQWGRHWLDLVRYAETNSFERDGLKPNAWRYRDYVIRSFNADKPYDQFLREQIAGDELDRGDRRIDHRHRLLSTRHLGRRAGRSAASAVTTSSTTSSRTTGQAILGMTVGCARCHDHKIDPIPQTDYYGLLAFSRMSLRMAISTSAIRIAIASGTCRSPRSGAAD